MLEEKIFKILTKSNLVFLLRVNFLRMSNKVDMKFNRYLVKLIALFVREENIKVGRLWE